MLSIFLLLQKNTVKLENLLLIGYTPKQIALPYNILAVSLNLLVLTLSVGGVTWLRSYYTEIISTLFPQIETGTLLPCWIVGCTLFLAVSLLNIILIHRKSQAFGKVSKHTDIRTHELPVLTHILFGDIPYFSRNELEK